MSAALDTDEIVRAKHVSAVRLRSPSKRLVPCANCSVPMPMRELTDGGICRLCIDEEGTPIDDDLEAEAVRRCQAAGLKAHARPCGEEDCKSCLMIRGMRPPEGAPLARGRRRKPIFNDFDAERLKTFFSRPPSAGIGGAGGFGAMVERIREATDYKARLEQASQQRSRMTPGCPICAAKAAVLRFRKVGRGSKAEFVSSGVVTTVDMLALLGVAPSGETPPFDDAEPTDQDVEATISRLTPKHGHSAKDRAAVAPVRVYDKEVRGQVVQVRVMPPTIGPESAESEMVATNETQSCGRYGSWEDQATDHTDETRSRVMVRRALERLPRALYDVLEARYGSGEERAAKGLIIGEYAAVAVMTPTAVRLRKQRARDGELDLEDIEELGLDENGDAKARKVSIRTAPSERGVLLDLDEKRTSGAGSAEVRKEAKTMLERIRAESEELVRQAQEAYAWASASE